MKTINRIKAAAISTAVAATSVLGSFASAPAFISGAADNDNYAKLLQYSLYFYDANMCGDNSSGGLDWRSNCHMDDEIKGGFHDAGDHVMFGLPQGYTAAALGLSYYEFKDAYDATGQGDHIKVILDHFCSFFRDSTKLNGDNVSNFLYQKGEGNPDHGYWGPPETQGSGRKMYWTNSGASDIAANYAAALAINYKNFGNADDLKYAKALYNFSIQHNQCATDGPDTFYASQKCKDEQVMAAGALALATGDSGYKNTLSSGVGDIGVWWAYGWNDANLGAAVMNGIVNKDWSAANGYLGSKCTGSNYLFLDKWGSARLNCSMQFMALVATKEGGGNYTDWATGQMNYILGNNPANTCFVTGFASNSAKNAHHRAASGYTSYDQFNMNGWDAAGDHMSPFAAYGANAHPLIGALVGGPCDANGSYHDNMADYVCNEVAIDYNAGLVGAAAGLYHFKKTGSVDTSIPGVTKIYSGSSTTPTPQPTDPPQQQNPTDPPQQQNPTNPPQQTTQPSNPGTSSGDIVLLPADMTVGTETGSDDEINNYAEFKPQGAKSATLYFKLNSSDTQASGGFGTWNGEWIQEDFENVKADGNKEVVVDYTIPSNVGATVKAMIWWPHDKGVTIEKVVLHMDGSSSSVQTPTQAPVTQPPVTQPPVTQPPVTQPPVTQPPVTQPPVTQPPVTQPPQQQSATATMYGDANEDGRVNIADAVAILQCVANASKYPLTETGKANADIDGQAGLTGTDAITIQKLDAGVLRYDQIPLR